MTDKLVGYQRTREITARATIKEGTGHEGGGGKKYELRGKRRESAPRLKRWDIVSFRILMMVAETTAAAPAGAATGEEPTWKRIPWPLYPLAPFVIIPGILLGLWMWPAVAFAALTVRRAVRITSNAWAVVYACVFALVFVASFAWPFALMYGLSELL